MKNSENPRRKFLKSGAALAATAFVGPSLVWREAWGQVAGQVPLAGSKVVKYLAPLVNPLDPSWMAKQVGGVYTLKIEETLQPLGIVTLNRKGVPTNLPKARVWGYRGDGMTAASYPGPTFDFVSGSGPVTVNFVNNLVDPTTGNLLPNRMPVDTSLDWANPGNMGANAPIPVATHLHGGDNRYAQDGLPDAWTTPGATAGASQGTCTAANTAASTSSTACTGRIFTSSYVYDNTQEGGFLWYHDHALGITRTNVYMGLAGLYFLREQVEQGLRTSNVLPSFPYEVPLVLQDRQFDTAGQLYYPSAAPAKTTATAPSSQPEFFGDVILVNTQAWPVMKVEPRPYRFRILNGSDSRAYELKLLTAAGKAGPAITVIGNDLGLLDKAAVANASYAGGPRGVLSIMPGERYDIIIDFTAFAGVLNTKTKVVAPTRLLVKNSAAAPYAAGAKPVSGLTDQIMAFDVLGTASINKAVPVVPIPAGTTLRATALPAPLAVGVGAAAPAGVKVRKILMYEGVDRFGRLQTMLGTVDPVYGAGVTDPLTGKPGNAMTWNKATKTWEARTDPLPRQGTLNFTDDITETPVVGSTEIWEFYNTTVDSHPMHMHLVDFRIIDRRPFTGTLTPKTNTDLSAGGVLKAVIPGAAVRGPQACEAGRKDTVQCHPGEVTRVMMTFKQEGEYVYHCHILSHEDHEMMRRFLVVPKPAI